MGVYLEHPTRPTVYKYLPAGDRVTVERWEGAKLVRSTEMSAAKGRNHYRYMRDKVGYLEFGFVSSAR